MRELTVTVPAVEARVTLPPAPEGGVDAGLGPVVASIGAVTLIGPLVLTVSVPPLAPSKPGMPEPAPPFKVTLPWISRPGSEAERVGDRW